MWRVTKSKLVLFEGVMGSGKTSTAQFAADVLKKNNCSVELYLEGNLDHPADYDRVACLEVVVYEELLKQHHGEAAALAPFVTRRGGEVLVAYGKADRAISLPLWTALQGFDIYDGIGIEKHRELLQARWGEFAAEQAARESTVIFDCAFFQNPMCAFLAKHDAGREAVEEHIMTLAQKIQPLNPLLVYFYQTNLRESVERVCQVRSKEWLQFVISYHTEHGLGRAQGWSGFDGLISFLEMRQELELELCEKLPFQTLVLENSNHDWDAILPNVERALVQG